MRKVSYHKAIDAILETLSNNRSTLEQIDIVIPVNGSSYIPAMVIGTEIRKTIDLMGPILLDTSSPNYKGKNILLVKDIINNDRKLVEIKNELLKQGATGVELFSVFHVHGDLVNPLYSKEVSKEVCFAWS